MCDFLSFLVVINNGIHLEVGDMKSHSEAYEPARVKHGDDATYIEAEWLEDDKDSLSIRTPFNFSAAKEEAVLEHIFASFPNRLSLIKHFLATADFSETGLSLYTANLPEDVKLRDGLVADWIDLDKSGITSLPNGLVVKHGLDIRDTDISELPPDLKAGGLMLWGSSITTIPPTIEVTGEIDADKGQIKNLDELPPLLRRLVVSC